MRKGFKVLIIAYILILGIGAIYGMATLNQKLQSLDATDLSPLRLAYAVFVFCTFIHGLIYHFKTYRRPEVSPLVQSNALDVDFTQNEPDTRTGRINLWLWILNAIFLVVTTWHFLSLFFRAPCRVYCYHLSTANGQEQLGLNTRHFLV